MSRKRTIFTAILFLSLFFIFAGNANYASAKENDNTVCQGVFIDEVDIGGMTKEQAKAAVDEFVEGLRNAGVAIMVGEDIVYSTMGDLGYTYEPNDNIEQAISIGKSGNLIKRYKDLKDIEQGNIVYPLTFTFDEEKIKELVSKEVSSYNVDPVNASVKRENGQFVYTNHQVGSKVNVEETTKLLADAMANWNRQEIVINAVVEDDMPIYTKDIVEKCNDLLGSFTTDFSTSSVDRAANVSNGGRLINNAVLYPGDVFSAYEYLTPFTAENGYYTAGAYLNGKVIDSVGGGACQVTTTLYNTVLNAELEIVERQPHSMTISYVDLSRDAAIAGTYKDFKFKNNTDTPILIEAITHNRKITFNIYGNETRDTQNRKFEFVTKVISETKPPADVITKDPNQPTTYRKVTQSAHIGYKTELYKVVYENGKEVSRTLVNTSYYQAAPQYITIGTKEVEEDKDTTGKDDTNTGSDDNKNNNTTKPNKKPNNQTKPDDQTTSGDNTVTDGQISTDDQEAENSLEDWNPEWDFEDPVE